MENQTDNYSQLKERIRSLKENRKRIEAHILHDLSMVYAITQAPAPYIKQVTRDLAADKDFRTNLLKIGLNLGTNYLYKMVSRPKNGAALLSVLSERLGLKGETTKSGSLADLLRQLLAKLSPEETPK
jgi:hypothetical protein